MIIFANTILTPDGVFACGNCALPLTHCKCHWAAIRDLQASKVSINEEIKRIHHDHDILVRKVEQKDMQINACDTQYSKMSVKNGLLENKIIDLESRTEKQKLSIRQLMDENLSFEKELNKNKELALYWFDIASKFKNRLDHLLIQSPRNREWDSNYCKDKSIEPCTRIDTHWCGSSNCS